MSEELFLQKIDYQLKSLGIELAFDPKSEIIFRCRFYSLKENGEAVVNSTTELVQELCLGKRLSEVRQVKKMAFLKDKMQGALGIIVPEILALDRCIDHYFGGGAVVPNQKDLLCTCFNLTERRLKQLVLKDAHFDLKKLVAETHATSACGSCLPKIKSTIEKIRNENGVLQGAKSNRARKNSKGEWIKVAGLYPIDFLIALDDLKEEWLKKNDLHQKINIKITKLEGLHVHIEIDVDDEFKRNLLLEALRDFVLDKLGVLIFFDV